ncbi:AAA family ATPase [Nocardia sp. NPDC059180]|uniref:nucleotide-binding protein n=1 Tax=Nocardia sp. NPDC059180 TaxID=3346761 RepID=UPI0036C7D93C
MSRSNDGLPMLPPWLSDSEVTQVGQQIDYEAPPVQNLPHDDLIEDTPAPKRRFKRPAPEADRSDAPGPRKEKKRKPWRRDKNDEQQVADQFDDEADSGHRAPRPNDQWSNPPQQTDGPRDQWSNPPQHIDGPGDRWQSAPPEQRPAPSDYGPSDRSQGPDARPADPYQSGSAHQQPYRPAPDGSWQQGPAQTGERPATHLPVRTPSEPPADFRPLGPRPPQPPVDQAPVSTEATVHLGPRPDLPAPPPPQAPLAPPQAPLAPPQAPLAPPQAPLAPTQAPVAPPQTPVAPPQRPVPPTQPPVAAPERLGPPPQDRLGPVEGPTPPPPDTQRDGSVPDQAPNEGASAQGSAASPADRPSLPEPPAPETLAPQAEFQAQQSAPRAQSPVGDAVHAPRPADQGQAADTTHTATEPPSWLDGPRGDGGQVADGGQAGGRMASEMVQQSAETAAPSNSADSRAVDSASTSTAADSATETDAPPSWLGPADSASAPEQPTTQRPLQRLPDLPPSPSESDMHASAPATDAAAPEQVPPTTPRPADAAPADAVRAPGPDSEPHHVQAGPAEQSGDQNRTAATGGRLDAADDAVSATRGRHRLASEITPASSTDQLRPSATDSAELRQQAPEQGTGQQFTAPDAPVPPRDQAMDRARAPHAGPTTHSSGFDHRLPPQSAPGAEQGPAQAPHQQWHTGRSGADAALRAALAAQPLRSFDGAPRESTPAPEQRQAGQPPADQQGRPAPTQAPQWQSPVAPGPDSAYQASPHQQAGMRAPSDQAPGPQGYAQAPGPQQHAAPPHSAPQQNAAPQYPSAPQHPVPPQHSGPPQQQWRGSADQGPPQDQWQGGPGQQSGASPSLDNVPIRGRATKKASGSGWRKAVHHVSGGAINPGMSAEELRLQELVARIRQPVRGDYRIAVLSLKGGVGKTTTTMGIGSTFASIRGDRVIAVDANPDFGTLSQRVPLQTRSTVRDLLLDSEIQRYSDVRRHTSQATSRLEVLASERDPAASEAFNEDEYRSVARILQRFYNIILTDCGTGLMHSAMAGVLELAHSLVLISSPAIDGARSAAATLDWLSLHGHDHLVRNAVVVINSPRAGSPNVGIQQLREYFLSRCRAVHIIPFDPHMSEGAEIDLHRLHKQTKRAYVELAATVADDFATDHRRYRG